MGDNRGGRSQVRARFVFAGVALVALPSTFTIFPELTRWSLPARVLLTVVWIGLVVATVRLGDRRNEKLDRVLATAERQRDQLRLRATDDILTALLTDRGPGLPDHYRFTIYVFEPDTDMLLPVFPEPGSSTDVRAFRLGCGATGAAYERKSLVLVTGDAVSDATWQLTPDQQRQWAGFRSVVATPIWVDGEEPIGVLSAISRVDDGCFFQPSAQARLRELADVIGVVLVNVAG